jgi:hypothetical protein
MWIKNIIQKIKKNKDIMITEDQLIGYKQNFTGQKFQWIKTNKLELLGKVVMCRDIKPAGGSAIAVFDDGSSIDVKRLNNDLMMIMGDMQPLSKEEVTSIYSPPPPLNDKKDPIQNNQTGGASRVESRIQMDVPPAEPINPTINMSTSAKANPFEMFSSEYSEFSIKMNIKLPDKKLLKLMYNNAENKQEFLEQLADYVSSSINNSTVRDSLCKMLEANPSIHNTDKSKVKEEIKLTEINND